MSDSPNDKVTFRLIRASEYSKCCELILKVFDEFNTAGFTDEGLSLFRGIVKPDLIGDGMQNGDLTWVAAAGGRLVGVIKLRDGNHIHFLFVDKDWHDRGIARRLFDVMRLHVRKNYPDEKDITVKSSLYAEPAYRALGFVATGPATIEDGIPSLPMKYTMK